MEIRKKDQEIDRDNQNCLSNETSLKIIDPICLAPLYIAKVHHIFGVMMTKENPSLLF